MNKIKLKKLAKIFFGTTAMFLMLAVFPACAFDGATLSEIKISSKDNYSYKVILKTDKDVPVEKYITSDNKIVIDLKNTKSAKFVNTIYNNTPEIDNVIVQAVSRDKVRIFIQGLNISSSKIILDSRNETLDFIPNNSYAIPATNVNNSSKPTQETSALPSTQSIETNKDIPVINLTKKANENSDAVPAVQEPLKTPVAESSLQASQNDLLSTENNTLEETASNSIIRNASLKKIFSKEGFDWILRIFAVIFLLIGMLKLINKPKNVTIELASENIKEREIELYKSINDRKELINKSLGSNYTREKPLKSPAYGANSQYALKEYRNSQLPPQKLNRPLGSGINKPAAPRLQSPQANSALKTMRPIANNSKINRKEINSAKSNIDNIKFLENMAAIYQKSGRTDLANNIRQKINSTKAVS